MFSERNKQWITGPFFYSITFKSWSDWTTSRPDKAHHWKEYRPIFWNIHTNESEEANEIQVLYLKPDGPINMLEIRIIVSEKDEMNIRDWLAEYGLVIC